MPLAVCLLALLTLTDRFLPDLLWPKIEPEQITRLNVRSVYRGMVDSTRLGSDGEIKVVVSKLKVARQSVTGKALLTLASSPPLERGDRIRFSARLKRPSRYKDPGTFDYRNYLRRRGILYTGYLKPRDDLEILAKGEGFLHAVDRVRAELAGLARRADSGEAGLLIAALVAGGGRGLSQSTRNDFRATGTSHLVAVSGQHVAIVGLVAAVFLLWLLKRSETILLSLSVRRVCLALTLIPVIFYVLVSGATPSATRAGWLAVFLVLGKALNREPEVFSSLAGAAILLTAVDPAAPFSVSFELSFLAVVGILLFRRSSPRGKGPFLRRYLLGPLELTVGAVLWTAPCVAYRFHEISFSGILLNLAAIPSAGLLLSLGLVGVVFAVFVPALGLPILRFDGTLAGFFLRGLHAAARWSIAHHMVASFYPTEWEVVLCFGAVGVLTCLRRHPDRCAFWRFPRLAFIVAVLVLLTMGSSFRWDGRALEVVFLDVGEGDSALVVTPTGKTLLVDGGGFLIPGKKRQRGHFDVGREVLVPYLKRRGISRIDVVLLSHPHPDHFGGLQAVFDAMPVGAFWWSGQRFPDAAFDDLIRDIRARGIPMNVLRDGDRFRWNGCGIEVVYPERIDPARNINDNSLVVRLEYEGLHVLFTGDIEKEGERALADVRNIRSEVLKIPHHGSRTSSSVPFIDSVQPQVAVASLGEENLFGFPHVGVLEKYERRGIKVFRTDHDGAVTVRLLPGSPRRSPSIQTASFEE